MIKQFFQPNGDPETRSWLIRIGLSLGAAVVAGALAYLVARAVTGVALFVQHQQLLSQVAGALSGGVDGLANGDLRAVRRLIEQLEARNQQVSLLAGFVVAALGAVASYLWLERRAEAQMSPPKKDVQV
jgi:H+/Cl- antiporter ClcA